MSSNFPSEVGDERFGMGDKFTFQAEVIGLELDILGKKVEFNINVGKSRMKLSDIVPQARTICSKIINISLDNNKKVIPCHKSCSACCSRNIVPLSVPEAFRLKEDISNTPENHRETIWNNCLQTARLILKQKPPESFTQQPADISQPNPADLNLLSDWYSNLNISCPFLHEDLCTIYEQRPLACREHFIAGSATACSGGHAGAEVLNIPIQMTTVLGRLAAEIEGTDVEAIMLPLSLIWCEENKQRAERTWPADLLIGRFIEIIQEMADNCSASLKASPATCF